MIINQLFDHIEFRRFEMNELKYIESFSKEEIIEKMQNYLNEVEADIENPRSDADDEFVASIKKEVWLKAIQLAKQIEEPKKVKIPQRAAEIIKEGLETGASKLEIISNAIAFASVISDNEFSKWFDNHEDIFIEAVVNDYEVEKV